MFFSVDARIQIDPDLLIRFHSQSERQWCGGRIRDPNHQNTVGCDKHLTMTLEIIRADLEPQINCEKPRGNI